MKITSLIYVLMCFAIAGNAQSPAASTFSESAIVLETSNGTIYGTLSSSESLDPTPIVLIIAGSGPTDRNCNSVAGVETNAYKMLSEAFANHGIACLRYDKRGIGESKSAITSEEELSFDNYVEDVTSWISLLKSDQRFSEIILLGHSEGSLIGIIAAERSSISSFISIAGAAKPADVFIQEQLKGKLPPTLMEESNRILDSLRIGKTVSEVNPYLASIYRPSVQPYMISWMKYNPVKEINNLKIPILLIQGTQDLQVSVEEANLLAEAKSDATLIILENMNHVLKESGANIQENMATYKNPDLPLKDGLIDHLTKFIKRHLDN